MSIVELNTSVHFSDIASNNYSIWISACASTMLSLLTCSIPSHRIFNKIGGFTLPQFVERNKQDNNNNNNNNNKTHTHKHLNK